MLTFYYAPQTRALSVRILLEELGAPYDLHVVDRQAGEQRSAEFLAINPLGKVPTIVHDGAVVTEQVAIFIYLADRFPKAGLAPAIDDPLRGPYLRWLAFYGAAFEPAMVDHYRKIDSGGAAMSPYGTYDAVVEALATQLSPGPYLLGDRMTAADILWSTAFGWTMQFGLLPRRPEFTALAERIAARPAAQKAAAEDAALAAQHAPPKT